MGDHRVPDLPEIEALLPTVLQKSAQVQAKASAQSSDLSFSGWNAWGGLKVRPNAKGNGVVLTLLEVPEPKAAGYVIERRLDIGGATLRLNVNGTRNSTFDADKLLKVEANDQPLSPTDATRKALNDGSYVTAVDGIVSFKLPESVTKLQIVFWNATLNDLELSAQVCR